MTDLDDPIVDSSIKPSQPSDFQFQPKNRSMALWSLGGLAAFVMVVAVVYDMGDGTRKTAPAAITAVPMGPTGLR